VSSENPTFVKAFAELVVEGCMNNLMKHICKIVLQRYDFIDWGFRFRVSGFECERDAIPDPESFRERGDGDPGDQGFHPFPLVRDLNPCAT